MENTNTPKSLEEQLDQRLEDKRNRDLEVRRQQVESIQGALRIATVLCPNCGARLIKGSVPMNEDHEDDGRA